MQSSEPFVAETTNHYEVLGPAEGAVLFAVLDDSLREAAANPGQLLKLLSRRGVYVDSRWGLVFRKALVGWSDPGWQSIR